MRVRAELKAAGFSVEPELCSQVPVDLGGIELSAFDGGLEIRATSVASQGTMTQVVDLLQATITAEVIAVRAVESFRAVLLQSLRSGEFEEQLISPELRHFTQFGLQPEVAKPAPASSKPPEKPAPAKDAPPKSRTPKKPDFSALFSVGPSMDVYPQSGGINLGGEARALVVFHGATLGLLGHTSLTQARTSLGLASMKTSAWSLMLRPGVSIPCGPKWECHVGILGGIYQAQFVVDDMKAEAFRHKSLLIQGDLILARFFDSGLGVSAQLRGGGLLDAPVLTSTRDDASITWGRPMMSASLALAYRL